jgi:hypothetical protein
MMPSKLLLSATKALRRMYLRLLCCLLLLYFGLETTLPRHSARGDVVFYRLPTRGGTVVTLEGTTTVNPGGTVTFQHPRYGQVHFDLESVDIRKALSLPAQLARVLGRAGDNAEKRMAAAQWALRSGMLPQFYKAIDKVLEIDPQHPRATLVKRLKAQIDTPLGDSSKQAAEMRALVGRDDMKIKQSRHFVLLHDTPDTLTRGKLTRADERIELLETVYECFLLRFYAYGVELEIPKERLKVVLFNDYQQFRQFADRLSPALASASGFWEGERNTSVFFDHGTNDRYKQLKELSDQLQQQKTQAIRSRGVTAASTVRLADTMQMLIEIEREGNDIQVVSHETTHQMAGNTGLLPRHVRIPSWVHEGLATYFETPDGATWGGIGAVNEQRLMMYRALARDAEHSNIGFIVGDQIFDYARSLGAQLHGYGQAWALTHFLMEKHFDKFLAFYRRLGELPPDTFLSAEIINHLFDESLGMGREELDRQWRSYMSSLKTDVELILEGN